MIFKLLARRQEGSIIWEWQHRKNFNKFSRWHYSTDAFDFRGASVYNKDFNLTTFLFCSRVSLCKSAKIKAYKTIESTDLESEEYIEVFRAHQTKLKDEWFEI